MSRTTLLTDGSKYSGLIRKKLKNENGTIILLSDSESEESPVQSVGAAADKKNDKDLNIVWNKRSPLSARNSILSALNKFGRIDDAVLIYQPGHFNKTFHETSSAVYDLQIDRWIKGYGYLLKEVLQLFLKQQNGTISFILDTDGMKVMTPLEGAIFSYLKSLLQHISVLYQNEAVKIYCFESDTGRRDDFIEFYLKTIRESKYIPGKILRFGDKKNLFDFGRN